MKNSAAECTLDHQFGPARRLEVQVSHYSIAGESDSVGDQLNLKGLVLLERH